MIHELTEYYDQIGILSTKFHCPYHEECLGKSKVPFKVKGKAAYIGSEYEKHTLRRILFVSQDPHTDRDFETPQKLTPEGVRAIEQNRDWKRLHPDWHWYKTHKLALLIAQVFKPELLDKDANHIFAHTNTAKCCPINKKYDGSEAVLYRNCQNYIKQEIELLDPDILIAQGIYAQAAIEFAFSGANLSYQSEYHSIVTIHNRIQILSINNRPVLNINTMIAPSWENEKSGQQESGLYPLYIDAVKAFYNQG